MHKCCQQYFFVGTLVNLCSQLNLFVGNMVLNAMVSVGVWFPVCTVKCHTRIFNFRDNGLGGCKSITQR